MLSPRRYVASLKASGVDYSVAEAKEHCKLAILSTFSQQLALLFSLKKDAATGTGVCGPEDQMDDKTRTKMLWVRNSTRRVVDFMASPSALCGAESCLTPVAGQAESALLITALF